jgi:protein TonB
MTNIANVFMPNLGNRSPILRFYSGNLRRAYFLTNAGIFILILGVFGFIRYQQWRAEEMMKKFQSTGGKKVITITYTQLGPPPSLMGETGGAPTAATGARPSAPVVGVPKPVADEKALQETSDDQTTISGVSNLPTSSGTGDGNVTLKIEDVIPDINAFVPVEVPAKPVAQSKPRYPEIARRMEQHGTVYVKMLINLDGSVMRVVVIKSSTFPSLDTAAVEAAQNWRFSPAIQNKKPVRVWVAAPIKFELE